MSYLEETIQVERRQLRTEPHDSNVFRLAKGGDPAKTRRGLYSACFISSDTSQCGVLEGDPYEISK